MVYLIMIFVIGASVSLAWLLAAGWRTVIAARRQGETFRATTLMHRTLLMAIVFGTLGSLLHLGVTRSQSFRNGLPAGLLTLDAKRPFYGRLALTELARRVMVRQINIEQCPKITAIVLAYPWWLDEESANPSSAGEKVGEGGETMDPGREWLATMQERAWLTKEDFAQWLTLDPPPSFTVPKEDEVDRGGVVIRYEYGREWTFENNLPYEIARVNILAVRVDGVPLESFNVIEISEGEAALGVFASRAIFIITDQPIASPAPAIEIKYTLNIEPGGYQSIGPLVWKSDR